MSKKKLSVVVLVLILLSGVAFASISGTFEGFRVVNVKVDNNLISSDVPAILLNGRTMVPLRVVSESLGANVSWDGSTSTALITRPTIEKSNKNLDYIYAMQFYKELQDIAESLSTIAKTSESLPSMYVSNWDYNSKINTIRDELNYTKKRLNSTMLKGVENEYIKSMRNSNFDFSYLDKYYSDCYKIISNYEVSLDYFIKGVTHYSDDDMQKYFNYQREAYKLSLDTIENTLIKYFEYMLLALGNE